jgi:hypothetical protein
MQIDPDAPEGRINLHRDADTSDRQSGGCGRWGGLRPAGSGLRRRGLRLRLSEQGLELCELIGHFKSPMASRSWRQFQIVPARPDLADCPTIPLANLRDKLSLVFKSWL